MRNLIAAAFCACLAIFDAAEAACRNDAKGDLQFVICEFHPEKDDIRLFLNDENGEPYGDFGPVSAALETNDEKLTFAMNAGMYHKDRSPVGLYIENYEEKKRLSTKDGPGNFHLKPNGVFFIWDEFDHRGANVVTSEEFRDKAPTEIVSYATQSGPVLVIDNAIHPRFLVDATSRKRRNGVGVKKDGSVVFVLSDTPVTFYEFASYFRDDLETPDALYLDGTISRVFVPELNRNDPGAMMGPIVGVVEKAK